jgi:2-amino-4-hydroxy-6-hydroxymethyldihydropteridine diphosphokinase
MDKKITAYIGVGSNIEPEKNIKKALILLMEKVKISAVSTFYRTKPLGGKNQDDYLNGVWEIITDLPAKILKFELLKKIEDKLKRERSEDKNSSRTIDLDLLLYGDLKFKSNNLIIPEPDIHSRDFVAIPLMELAPNLILPDTHEKLSNIVNKFEVNSLKAEISFTKKLKKIL